MMKELLPIGSVVMLKESTIPLMVAGYLPMKPDQPDYTWDYSGFRFPFGYMEDDDIFCFDENQIEAVYAYGYRDIEFDLFASRLDAAKKAVAEKEEQ